MTGKPKAGRKVFFLLLLAALIQFVFLSSLIGMTVHSDSESYVSAAKYLRGESPDIEPQRLLRPLGILLPFLTSYAVGVENSYLLWNFVFYFLTAVVIYFFTSLSLDNNGTENIAEKAGLAASFLFLFSFPALNYGLAVLADAGAWFFLVLSLYLVELCIRKPSRNLLLLAGFVTGFGILMKEIAAAALIYFALKRLKSFIANQPNKQHTRIGLLSAKKLCFFKMPKISAFRAYGKAQMHVPFHLWFHYNVREFALFMAALAVPVAASQILIFVYFNYTYLDWFLFNQSLTRGTLFMFLRNFLIAFNIVLLFFAADVIKRRKINIVLFLSLAVPIAVWAVIEIRFAFLLFPFIIPNAATGMIRLSKLTRLPLPAFILIVFLLSNYMQMVSLQA